MLATVVSLVTVTDSLVDHSLALSWQITQAAADEFVFTTPGWLKNHLRFRDRRIREVRRLAVDDETGEQVWKPAEGGPAVSAGEWTEAATEAGEEEK